MNAVRVTTLLAVVATISITSSPLSTASTETLNPIYSANVSAKTLNIEKCQIVRTVGSNKLSPTWKLSSLWAQEMVGSDIAIDFMSSIEEHVTLANLAIVDSDFSLSSFKQNFTSAATSGFDKAIPEDLHGEKMRSLIEENPYSSSRHLKWSAIHQTEWLEESRIAFAEIAKTETKLLNYSSNILSKKHIEAAQLLIDADIIFVGGGANRYPDFSLHRLIPHIIAPSPLMPNGILAPYADSGAAIVVPADPILTYRNSTTNGQSAAAAVTSSALANVISLLPNINPREAKILLSKTAIPTVSVNAGSDIDGPGMLNAYKLAKSSFCLKAAGFTSASAIRARLLSDPPEPRNCFDFRVEAENDYKEGTLLYNSKNLCDKKRGLQKLRSAFLLNSDPHIASVLQKIYLDLGFTGNALFYQSLSVRGKQMDEFLRRRLIDNLGNNVTGYFSRNGGTNAPGFAYASRLPLSHALRKEAAATIDRNFSSIDPGKRWDAVVQAGTIGPPEGFPILKKALTNPKEDPAVIAQARDIFYWIVATSGDSAWKAEAISYIKANSLQNRLPNLQSHLE